MISEKIVAEGEKWLDKHPKEENTGKGFFGRMFGKMNMGVNRLRGKTKNDDKKIEYQILHQKNIQFSGFTKSLFDVKSSILYQFKLEIPFPPPDRIV